jgi:hypothetical protein
VIGTSNTNLTGNYSRGFMNANAATTSSAMVTRSPTAAAAVTVVMFRANEPGAKGAFDALQVLAQYSQ